VAWQWNPGWRTRTYKGLWCLAEKELRHDGGSARVEAFNELFRSRKGKRKGLGGGGYQQDNRVKKNRSKIV